MTTDDRAWFALRLTLILLGLLLALAWMQGHQLFIILGASMLLVGVAATAVMAWVEQW
jgi:hypothetical protein